MIGTARRFLCVLCLALTPGTAQAGAWTLAEGDGQVIVTSGRRMAPARAFFEGLADQDSSTLSVFVEYGVTDELTLGVTASGEWDVMTAHTDLQLGAHVRYRLWQGEAGDVFSVQLGGGLPIERWFGDPFAGPSPESVAQAQFGLLYGRGWISDWGNSFATVEAAFRWRGGDRADELRLEGTAGHAFSHSFMVLLGAYSAVPLCGGDRSLTLAPSIAWTMWPWLGPNDKKPAEFRHPSTVQLGLVYDVLNPDDGLALTVSVWSRF